MNLCRTKLSSVQKPGWLMISWGIRLPNSPWGIIFYNLLYSSQIYLVYSLVGDHTTQYNPLIYGFVHYTSQLWCHPMAPTEHPMTADITTHCCVKNAGNGWMGCWMGCGDYEIHSTIYYASWNHMKAHSRSEVVRYWQHWKKFEPEKKYGDISRYNWTMMVGWWL